jgi:hypothetical protein
MGSILEAVEAQYGEDYVAELIEVMRQVNEMVMRRPGVGVEVAVDDLSRDPLEVSKEVLAALQAYSGVAT